MKKQDWRVFDRGVNDEPFLWRKSGGRKFLMIDIFNPDSAKRCYTVVVLPGNPYVNEDLKRETIGVGCAQKPRETWKDAYRHARKIAEEYMKNEN